MMETNKSAFGSLLKISHFNIDFWVDGVWYPAVIDMNMELAPGKVTAIVGESGAGKSRDAQCKALIATQVSWKRGCLYIPGADDGT